MARRLVLGCGSIGHAVVVGLSNQPGELRVVDADPDRVETLRNEGIHADQGDPTEVDELGLLEGVDTILVAGDDPTANRAAAATAEETHPEAVLVALTGEHPSPSQRDELESIADRLVNSGFAVVDVITDMIEGGRGQRHGDLLRTLRDIDGRLGVFAHDNPDPDAIASAIALRDLARSVGIDAEACYFGDISHQENRALVNLLDIELREQNPGEFDPGEFTSYALVDHSRPGINDQLPEDLPIDVVIDHHPPRGPVAGKFVDLRENIGATSTLLADYYRTLGAELPSTVATALLYGIRVDTQNFSTGITKADFEAAAYLLGFADIDVLARIESPSVSREMLTVLASAISNRTVRGPVLATSAGWTTDRDALAEAANTLLEMEGLSAVLVLGLFEEQEMAIASARSRGMDLDIGGLVRLAYDPIGSAGGHTNMAGAQIPLGILGNIEDEAGALEEVIADVLIDRFFEVLEEEGVLSRD